MQKLMENFELLLTVLVLICLVFYILDGRKYRKERNYLLKVFSKEKETDEDRNKYSRRLLEAEKSLKPKHRELFQAVNMKINNRNHLSGQELIWASQPVYKDEKLFEFFGGMFWILFIVLFVRSFLWEPFKIPSSSMEPTLQKGDFILTQKYAYGVKLPVLGWKILPLGGVKRGDVFVFRYPNNPKLHYIKRVIALPGDKVVFNNGKVIVNGQKAVLQLTGKRNGYEDNLLYKVYEEEFNYGDDKSVSGKHLMELSDNIENKHINSYNTPMHTGFIDGVEIQVPEGHYFAMGDNRDSSSDSRMWGFVPAKNLVGKASYIWLNSDCVSFKGNCKRIGRRVK
ncbi:MAG: signal peptidase I [Cardiobacteriaceae bacterium]|nr:signal peptidase I [Cardiobacteriaceae bacterium]